MSRQNQEDIPIIDGIRFSYIINEFIPTAIDNITTSKGTSLNELSTTDVCEQIIKPATILHHNNNSDGRSYCEMLQNQNHWAVVDDSDNEDKKLHPSIFVSHAHSYKFVDLINALQYHLRNEPDDVVVWLDLFCINQHSTSTWSFDWLRDTFRTTISQIGRVVMVMSPWDNPLPFTRAWCIYEVYCCACVNTGGKFEIALSENDKQRFIQDIMDTTTTINQNSDDRDGQHHTMNDPRAVINRMMCQIRSDRSVCRIQSDQDLIFDIIHQSHMTFYELDSMLFDCYREWTIQTLLDSSVQHQKRQHACEDSVEWSQRRLRYLQTLGLLYEGQGKFQKAEQYLLNHLEACRNFTTTTASLSSKLEYSDSLFHLAQLYEYSYHGPIKELSNEKELSISGLYQECFKSRESCLGHVHPLTLDVKFDLARREGNKLLMEQILAVLRRRKRQERETERQPNEPNNSASSAMLTTIEKVLIECLQEMAAFYDTNYLLSSHNKQGEALLLECLYEQQVLLGLDHPDTLKTTYRLARVYHRRIHAEAASGTASNSNIANDNETITTSMGTFYDNVMNSINQIDPDAAGTHNSEDEDLVTTPAREKKAGTAKTTNIDDIIDLMEPCYERQKRVLGIDHPNSQRSMVMLRSLYMKSNPKKAFHMHQQMLQLQEDGRLTAI